MGRDVSARKGIRHRLATFVLLGVLTSALSLFALVHLLSTSTVNRSERAQEAVTQTLERLEREPINFTDPAPLNMIGLPCSRKHTSGIRQRYQIRDNS